MHNCGSDDDAGVVCYTGRLCLNYTFGCPMLYTIISCFDCTFICCC